MSRKRNPLGSDRRWRLGHALRVEDLVLAAVEQRMIHGIAGNLSRQLRDRDISMAELAAAVGVHVSMVKKWVSGEETPTLWRLVKISMAMGCPVVDLLPDEATLR